VLLAFRFALASEELGLWAVPRIVVDGEPRWDGAVPEAEFLRRVLA
jgi:thioredoxin family protein